MGSDNDPSVVRRFGIWLALCLALSPRNLSLDGLLDERRPSFGIAAHVLNPRERPVGKTRGHLLEIDFLATHY